MLDFLVGSGLRPKSCEGVKSSFDICNCFLFAEKLPSSETMVNKRIQQSALSSGLAVYSDPFTKKYWILAQEKITAFGHPKTLLMTGPSYTISQKRLKELDHLSERLGIRFGRMGLLNESLTHSSFAGEHPGVSDNERLEFFGDAVLRFVMSEYLLERFPDYDEGQLTAIRSVLVSDKTLAEIGQAIGLSKYILVGRQVQIRPSIVARSIEALFGAIYIDLGLIEVQNVVLRLFGNKATDVDRDEAKDNFKAQLQELTQSKGQGIPQYVVSRVEGPPHEPVFFVTVSIEGKEIGAGSGTTKKSAEQSAAKQAMQELGRHPSFKKPAHGAFQDPSHN